MTGLGNKPLRYLLQALNYSVFMALIWYFATSPSIRIIDADESVITIAFAHAGALREPCRKLSSEELAELAPNMRKLEDCPRERSDVSIEARLDGEIFYRETLSPPGLFKDGGVDVFFSTRVASGNHDLSLKMNDSARVEGFNHLLSKQVHVDAGRILLVDFDHKTGFIFGSDINQLEP